MDRPDREKIAERAYCLARPAYRDNNVHYRLNWEELLARSSSNPHIHKMVEEYRHEADEIIALYPKPPNRPELREKLKELARQFYWWSRENPHRGHFVNLEKLTEQVAKDIEALFPDVEEIEKRERERIIGWLKERATKKRLSGDFSAYRQERLASPGGGEMKTKEEMWQDILVKLCGYTELPDKMTFGRPSAYKLYRSPDGRELYEYSLPEPNETNIFNLVVPLVNDKGYQVETATYSRMVGDVKGGCSWVNIYTSDYKRDLVSCFAKADLVPALIGAIHKVIGGKE